VERPIERNPGKKGLGFGKKKGGGGVRAIKGNKHPRRVAVERAFCASCGGNRVYLYYRYRGGVKGWGGEHRWKKCLHGGETFVSAREGGRDGEPQGCSLSKTIGELNPGKETMH